MTSWRCDLDQRSSEEQLTESPMAQQTSEGDGREEHETQAGQHPQEEVAKPQCPMSRWWWRLGACPCLRSICASKSRACAWGSRLLASQLRPLEPNDFDQLEEVVELFDADGDLLAGVPDELIFVALVTHLPIFDVKSLPTGSSVHLTPVCGSSSKR